MSVVSCTGSVLYIVTTCVARKVHCNGGSGSMHVFNYELSIFV